MFTHKDIEFRSIFVLNCINNRILRVSDGALLLEEEKGDDKITLTKLPFQKLLALFVIGNITITTPFIDKCKRFNVALIVVKPNLRPIYFLSSSAEANYLLRQKQYMFPKEDISIGKILIANKITNQRQLLVKTRLKDYYTTYAISQCNIALQKINEINDYNMLLSVEGNISKIFFATYYSEHNWKGRKPRAKIDAINATLDIGYTILFNYLECFARMFGFDLFVGVYHRLWFKRKSLICDLMEPFRCIIDRTIRIAYNKRQCSEKDFVIIKDEYKLKYEKNGDYYKLFFDALIPYKTEIFLYMQKYYRCFMNNTLSPVYPFFNI